MRIFSKSPKELFYNFPRILAPLQLIYIPLWLLAKLIKWLFQKPINKRERLKNPYLNEED